MHKSHPDLLLKTEAQHARNSFDQWDSSQNPESETENAREHGRKEIILRYF